MNNILQSKISAYSTLAASFVALAKVSNAQIVYTDIDPDDTLSISSPIGPGEWYSLDLNNDGIIDYSMAADIIYFEYAAMIGKYLNGSGTNSVAGVYYNGFFEWYNVFKLEYLDTIDAGLSWAKPKAPTQSYMGNLLFVTSYPLAAYGYWKQGVIDGYIGLRFQAGNDRHYGWLRCDVAADASYIVIKDYAYNSIPYQGILAGASAACIDVFEPNNNAANATSVIPDVTLQGLIPAGTDRDFYSVKIKSNEPHLKIQLSDLPKNYNLRLLNSTGQKIAQSVNPQKEDEEIIANNLTPGKYIVLVLPKDQSKFDPVNCYTLNIETSNAPFKLLSSDSAHTINTFIVFPNPVSTAGIVKFQLKTSQYLEVGLHDIHGKQLMQIAEGHFSEGNHEINFSAESLPKGMYLLQIKTGSETQLQKLIIQ